MTRRILIVDDEPDTAVYLSALLSDEGHATRTAGDAEEARALLDEERFDLILLDVQLPGTTGLKLYYDLRADPRFGNIPVIMVTGVGPFQVFDGSCRPVTPPVAILDKPVDRAALLVAVRDALAH